VLIFFPSWFSSAAHRFFRLRRPPTHTSSTYLIHRVESAAVSLITHEAEVEFDASVTGGPRPLVTAVQEAGFSASLRQEGRGDLAAANERERRQYWDLFKLSMSFTVPLFLVSMVLPHLRTFRYYLLVSTVQCSTRATLLLRQLDDQMHYVVSSL
jgi:cation transport ATPase